LEGCWGLRIAGGGFRKAFAGLRVFFRGLISWGFRLGGALRGVRTGWIFGGFGNVKIEQLLYTLYIDRGFLIVWQFSYCSKGRGIRGFGRGLQ